MTTPKDFNLDNKSQSVLKELIKNELQNYIGYSGIGNKKQNEILTNFDQTDNEFIVRGKTNALIVLGNDRPAGQGSGYGGVGQSGCATIDLIAGHMGTLAVDKVNNNSIKSSKNFENDAARIYISQLCDLDEYFSIPKQYVMLGNIPLDIQTSKAQSGIGLKADSITLIGRENIKICTYHHGTNSQRNKISPGGVDIYAGIDASYDDKHNLEPMVKGNKLIAVLQEIISSITNVQATVSSFINIQQKINDQFLSHKHNMLGQTITNVPLNYGIISNLCVNLNADLKKHIQNNITAGQLQQKYFNPSEKTYINSNYNRVN